MIRRGINEHGTVLKTTWVDSRNGTMVARAYRSTDNQVAACEWHGAAGNKGIGHLEEVENRVLIDPKWDPTNTV